MTPLERHTPRLILVAADLEQVEAELRGRAALQSVLGASVPDDWPPGEYDRGAQEFFRDRLAAEGPSCVGWLTWYAMTRTDASARDALVAGAGFFGPPQDGRVEIGYSVVAAARGRGYATEIVTELCSFAFSHADVHTVIAHTSSDNIASWRVLLRCGFTQRPDRSQPDAIEYALERASRRPPIEAPRRPDERPLEIDSVTARLCIEGTQAEFERRLDDARGLFARAWEEARDDYERAIAAHYVAHLATEPETAHRWNLLALEHARLDGRAARFMGSLLVCLGDSFERLGDVARAERYFAEAARHGVEHSRR